MNLMDVHTFTGLKKIPTLILVDLQKEYTCKLRPLGLEQASTAIDNCKRLLTSARQHKFPIAFMKWSQDRNVFNPNSTFSDWIDGLQPTQSDMVFEHHSPSCYSSTDFSRMMNDVGQGQVIIAGFTSSVSCLATIVDGVKNQHRFVFVNDASASHAHNGKKESEVHEYACFLISIFGQLKTTDHVLEDFSNLDAQTKSLFVSGGAHAI